MANLRSLLSFIVCVSMMQQPIMAKRLFSPPPKALHDDESKLNASQHANVRRHLEETPDTVLIATLFTALLDAIGNSNMSVDITINSSNNQVGLTNEISNIDSNNISNGNPEPPTPPECPSEIVTNASDLGLDIPDGDGVDIEVTLPVELEEGCSCTVDNVAITIGIDHPNVGDLDMTLIAPDDDLVTLVVGPPSDADLVAGNKIAFDDSVENALDPDDLGDGLGGNDIIPAGTYFAQGTGNGVYPNDFGLGKFNGKVLPAEGNWSFEVFDFSSGDSGTLQSVELTITCE